jgi:heat shock protein HtpX
MVAALGLSTYRWNNNLKSILLLAAFPFLLLLLLAILVYLAAWFLFADSAGLMRHYQFQRFGLESVTGGHGALDFTCAFALAYWPYVVGAAAIWLLLAYFFNDALIHRATGAKEVAHAESPKLYNLLENLCISRGLKTPRLYIIDTEAMNAYASGIDQRSYSITVTSGLLAQLNDEELEAVLAHELTHILDRDVRLLLVTILFVGVISFLAQLLWRSLRVISFGRSRRGGGGVLMFILAAAVVAGVGYLLALVLRFAISREREYLADAGSVDLTKHPEALISALRKIATNPAVPHVPSEVRQMFIENPPAALTLFDTHPPIEARIKALERLAGIAPQASAATLAGTGAGTGVVPVSARASAGAPTAPGWITGLTLAGSLGYALLLLYANVHNPGFVEALAAQLAPVTEAVAGAIPASLMADNLANPAIGISAVMIRHLFPALILVNGLFGVLSFGYIGALATHYARRLTSAGGITGLFVTVYLAVAVLSFYPLVGAPAMAVVSQQPIAPMGLGGYLAAAASPAVFFYCLRQALALAQAGRRMRDANRVK